MPLTPLITLVKVGEKNGLEGEPLQVSVKRRKRKRVDRSGTKHKLEMASIQSRVVEHLDEGLDSSSRYQEWEKEKK